MNKTLVEKYFGKAFNNEINNNSTNFDNVDFVLNDGRKIKLIENCYYKYNGSKIICFRRAIIDSNIIKSIMVDLYTLDKMLIETNYVIDLSPNDIFEELYL